MEVIFRTLKIIYGALIKYEAVYLFYLVPIAYFTSIVIRLIYYKLKYHKKLPARDIMAVATMLVIVLDYVNYLYLLISRTGNVLPFGAFLIKYTLGFMLWAWMFWYGYKTHAAKDLAQAVLKKWRIILSCFFSILFILFVIVLVFST